ncbi:hypothetical protein KJ966_00995 [bacterium]|nr:hypothetical protein [bacterium]
MKSTVQKWGNSLAIRIPKSGDVLSDQVKNMDWKNRNIEFICKLDKQSVEQVLQRLHTLL